MLNHAWVAKDMGASARRIGGPSGSRLTAVAERTACINQRNILVSGMISAGFALLLLALGLLVLGLLAQGLFVSTARAQETPSTPPAPTVPDTGEIENQLSGSVGRDSLMSEIRDYTLMIRSLRDSLSSDGGSLQLSLPQREQLEGSIADITQVIERISAEMSRMEFEIKDNRISLVNEAGEGIIINVPENMDEQVSEGIEALTRIILSEMPDSIDFDHSKKWDWSRFRPEPPAPPRRIINGNIVKVWKDVHISAKEDVRGNVVVIFGNAEISGRVDGTVVTVFGNLLLDETAEVMGHVVAVGGYLDRDPMAEVDNVVSVDPIRWGQGEGWLGFFSHGWMSFLVCQGTFLLTVLLAIVAVTASPRRRFDNIIGTLRRSVMPSLGVGLVTALGGHLAVSILVAVLVLTVIGVPLALLVGLALLIVVVLSVAVAGAVVGERLCALFGGKCHSPWLVVAVGMSALHGLSFLGSLLGLIGAVDPLASLLVVLGVALKVIAYLLGLGALVLSRFGAKATVS